jgi:predicted nucleic acid-binding protein
MNLVDSCAWLEYFADGPNAPRFAAAIEDTEHLLVPTIVLLEVFKRIAQQAGEEAAIDRTAHLRHGRVVGLDERIAIEAAAIGVELGLPLADSVMLATARRHGATVWTQDADFEGVEGVGYYARKP